MSESDDSFLSPAELAAQHQADATGEVRRLSDQVKQAFREPRNSFTVTVEGFGDLAINIVAEKLRAVGWQVEVKSQNRAVRETERVMVITRPTSGG